MARFGELEVPVNGDEGIGEHDFLELAEISESMIRLYRDGESLAMLQRWDNLTTRQQRLLVSGLIATIVELRREQGDRPK